MKTKPNTSADFNCTMDTIRDEMAANANDSAIQMIGSVLTELLQNHPELADKLSAEGKGLKKAMEAMKAEASKHKTGSWACLDGMSGMKVVLKHYEIKGISDNELVDAIMAAMLGESAPAPEPEADEFDIDALLGEV